MEAEWSCLSMFSKSCPDVEEHRGPTIRTLAERPSASSNRSRARGAVCPRQANGPSGLESFVAAWLFSAQVRDNRCPLEVDFCSDVISS